MPGEESFMEISLRAKDPILLKDLGFLQYYWKISYEGDEYKDFYLDGNADFSISPSTPDYFKPMTSQFIHESLITYDQPFDFLKTNLKINDQIWPNPKPMKINTGLTGK